MQKLPNMDNIARERDWKPDMLAVDCVCSIRVPLFFNPDVMPLLQLAGLSTKSGKMAVCEFCLLFVALQGLLEG